MTDFREPYMRNTDDMRRDPSAPRDLDPALRPWNDATWAWIAGAAVVALVVMFVFTIGSEPIRTASNTANPIVESRPTPIPPTPPAMNRPATPGVAPPSTMPAPMPSPENRQ